MSAKTDGRSHTWDIHDYLEGGAFSVLPLATFTCAYAELRDRVKGAGVVPMVGTNLAIEHAPHCACSPKGPA